MTSTPIFARRGHQGRAPLEWCPVNGMVRNPVSEWVTSDDRGGRNAGKLSVTYRLTAKGWTS